VADFRFTLESGHLDIAIEAPPGDLGPSAGLKDRMVEVQTTLVASPRNHLYRTDQSLVEVGLFCIGPKAKLHHFGDFADDLDFEAIIRGSYRNVVD
jgi:hypothetical protein